MNACDETVSSSKLILKLAWPDIRPQNAWCLSQSTFVPHIDRILSVLGLPVESRTAMITSWLPSVTRHKNIVSADTEILGSAESQSGVQVWSSSQSGRSFMFRRLLGPDQIAPAISLTIIPPPQVLVRVFVSPVNTGKEKPHR